MDMEYNSGKTIPNTRAIGLTIKQMVTALYTMQMEMYTQENGKMIKPTARENTNMPMAPNMMEIGSMINNMDMVLKRGQTEPNMKANIRTERKTEEENSCLQIHLCMKVNLKKMKLTGSVHMYGLIGNKYIGNWKNNKMMGEGTLEWHDGK